MTPLSYDKLDYIPLYGCMDFETSMGRFSLEMSVPIARAFERAGVPIFWVAKVVRQ